MQAGAKIKVHKRLATVQDELSKEKLVSQSLQNRLDVANRDLSLANGFSETHALEVKQLQQFLASANQTVDELRIKLASATKDKKPVGRQPKVVPEIVVANE